MEEVDFSTLPKKERKRLKKELEREQEEQSKKKGTIGKWITLGLLTLMVGLGITALAKEFSKPLPGQRVEDLGREHVAREQWEKYQYNSNPPTSGPHDATWIKAGIYDNPQGDGNLIHALEHGYVVISYNCEKKISIFHFPFSIAFAHETEEVHEEPMASESAGSSPSAELKGDVWENEDCQRLKKQLVDLAERNKLWKLIVVPRPNLDSKIALTAWARLDKMDVFSRERINRFIEAFRNKGPEKTTE